ncbi:hypothetical protein C2W62_51375, partial [Candidatus Entotheonella serta]
NPHDRLLSHISGGSLFGSRKSIDLLLQVRLVLLGLAKLGFQLGRCPLALLKAFAMPLGLRLSDLLALGLKLKPLFRHPTPRRFKRILHFRLSSLLMPVRTQDGLATHMEIEKVSKKGGVGGPVALASGYENTYPLPNRPE